MASASGRVDAGAFRAGIHHRLDPRVIPAAFGGYAVASMFMEFFRPPTGNSEPPHAKESDMTGLTADFGQNLANIEY